MDIDDGEDWNVERRLAPATVNQPRDEINKRVPPSAPKKQMLFGFLCLVSYDQLSEVNFYQIAAF